MIVSKLDFEFDRQTIYKIPYLREFVCRVPTFYLMTHITYTERLLESDCSMDLYGRALRDVSRNLEETQVIFHLIKRRLIKDYKL